MNTIESIKEQYKGTTAKDNSILSPITETAINAFDEMGIPTVKHEEWKYTRISSLFNKEYQLSNVSADINNNDINTFRLPGHEQANELVFVNGVYSPSLSKIISPSLGILTMEEATKEYGAIVSANLGHSSKYIKDGIHAMNTAFITAGTFIHVKRGKIVEHPVYIYQVADARSNNVLSQPRTLIHVGENAQVVMVETYKTIGVSESFTNEVMEVVVERDAVVEYYKLQNDAVHSSQVTTTHFRQTGKSYVHTVTISLSGTILRNNLNIVLEADHSEAHMYGLYFPKGSTHIDNHTVVDNVMPHCLSNELYKGIIDERASAVFNGKIFVQKDAQKTNAFQSNKNILLSDAATVNTKPQLEIWADDVKCSHGCTVGQLDEEGLFYLRTRGITEKVARSLLIHGYASDIVEHIKIDVIRDYIDQLISERLEYEIA